MAAVPPPKLTHAQANALLTAPGSPFELEEVDVRGIKLRCFKNAPPTLAALWQGGIAIAKPESDYLVLYDESGKAADRYKWKDAVEIVNAVSNYLANDLGLKKGERVAIAMRNWPEYVDFSY